MHLNVVVEEEAPQVSNVQYSAPEDPSGDPGMRHAAARQAAETGDEDGASAVPDEEVVNTPIVKSEHEKLGRNEPCWCGSGKKFKLCHGR